MPKVKVLEISIELLVDMLKPGVREFEVTDGVPDDAKVTYAVVDSESNQIQLTIESEQFPNFAPRHVGESIPRFDVNMRKIQPKKV